MKILHVCYSDHGGGAGIAATRLHNALLKSNVDSSILCVRPSPGGLSVVSAFGSIRCFTNRLANKMLWRFFTALRCALYPGPCSVNLIPTGLHRKINASDVDVVHLHWVNAEMISVGEIAKIKKPIVWTLHDMWAFCGMEHCSEHGFYRDGYVKAICGNWKAKVLYQIDRWTWNRKRRVWANRSFQIVTPGSWMAKCVRSSILLGSRPVEVIPNCFDLKRFAARNPADARRRLGLPLDKALVLTGAASVSARHKGMDLFLEALKFLDSDVDVVTFGGSLGISTEHVLHEMGAIWDEEKMALLYSAVDLFVLPSRIDNFPSTGVESLACGTPVVAFRIGGLPDMVDHKKNGYLAEPFEIDDLVRGMEWVLERRSAMEEGAEEYESKGTIDIAYGNLCRNAREKVERCFSEEVVVSKFRSLYERVVKG